MKIKLDENLPEMLAGRLSALGHDVDTVRQEMIAGHDDETVWAAAQEAGRFLITQDLDFSDTRKSAPGTHHGILLVRLRSAGRVALAERISEALASHDVDSWPGCFVILSDHKLRVRRASA